MRNKSNHITSCKTLLGNKSKLYSAERYAEKRTRNLK